jgi:hypothetical protein
MKSFKTGKKIRLSRRDNIMLTVLVILAELYFMFYRVLWTRYDALLDNTAMNIQKERQIAILKSDYDKTAEYKAQLGELLAAENEARRSLPDYASQEELILLVDSLSRDTGLTVMVGSFQSLATIRESDYLAGSQSSAEAAGASGASGLLVADQGMSLSFSGTFDMVYDFLNRLESNERKACVQSLSLTTDNKGKVSGSMQVSFLSLIDPANPNEYEMQLDPIAGKASPFTPYAGYWATAGAEDANEPAVLSPDFALYINSYLDNAPGVIITDYKDASSRLSAEINRVASCKITFEPAANGYNYTFELEGKALESAAPVTAKNNEIVIEIIAQSRRDNEDLTAATLEVANNTPLPVRVVVSKDDKTNPRFMMGSTSGRVSVE